jgi:hypothetical protein
MENVFLRVCYGLGQTVFPRSEKIDRRNFSQLTGEMLKRITGLPPKVRDNLTITSPAIQVPKRFLAAALGRIEKNSPVLCASAFPPANPPKTFKEAVSFMIKHLKQEEKYNGQQKNAIGAALDLLPPAGNSGDPWAGGAICLSFCPYFGLSFQVKLPLFSVQAIHTDLTT